MLPAQTHKTCNKCKKTQPIEEFNMRSSYERVRKNSCRQCTYKYAKTYRKNKKDASNGPSLFADVELVNAAASGRKSYE